ncbi:hypothetical protein CBG53_00850 [Porphyromonas gingivalis]|uniref:Bacterial toxin-antitoxin, HicA-like n=1 Tax=Porphyromonas phage phage023a_KCOM2797 TaxID=3154113 RepID=A0AAT9J8V2_9CAUD|nr:hypothetical protein CBG53_00850 [Porphyromonas gingivalis]
MLFFFRNMPSFCVFLSSSSFFFVQQSNSPTNLPIKIRKQLKIKYLQNSACRTVRIRLLVLLVGRWKAPFQQKNLAPLFAIQKNSIIFVVSKGK